MTPSQPLHWRDLPAPVLSLLRQGSVIPAHPLALGPDRQFDRQSQRAISRYYVDAGSGGLAVGVHSTQFAIREVGLYRPVLELAMASAAAWTPRHPVMIAEGVWCLDPAQTLGRGQKAEIDRVCAAYPHLNDDAFVRANLERWLS